MSKEKILAMLKEHGQEVAADASDEVILNALQSVVKNRASSTPNSDPGEVAKLTRTVENITAQLENERKTRITATVNAMLASADGPRLKLRKRLPALSPTRATWTSFALDRRRFPAQPR